MKGAITSTFLITKENGLTSVSDEEVVKVMVGVRILGLKGEDWSCRRRVEVHHSLDNNPNN